MLESTASRSASQARQAELEAFYADLRPLHSGPLWLVMDQLLPAEPKVAALPHLWQWTEMRPQVLRAGQLIGTDEAERRVLMLLNPGLKGKIGATQTLFTALQLILPGEVARTHRHSPAALRFIIEGQGAYTAVAGEKTLMSPGDFVLTPSWTWHDHGNESDQPMIWLDGLDIPLVHNLDAVFFEQFPEPRQPVSLPLDDSVRRYGSGLKPTWSCHVGLHTPILNYTYERSRPALSSLAYGEASRFDDIILEYTNPYTGGPVLPTMAAYLQMLRPNAHTRAHRHSISTVYNVVEGNGYSVINGQRFTWAEKDVFVVPSWAWHEHVNRSPSREAVLFSFTDSPVLTALGLYREEELLDYGGQQSEVRVP